jgi:hypothetical protein
MEIFVLALVMAFVGFTFQARDERQRIALLASYLEHYQLEKLMETLTQGYMRALGEQDLARQAQIWSMLTSTENALCEQFKRFVADFSRVASDDARVSKLPLSIFYTGKLFPQSTFDLRKAFSIHAHGITAAVANASQHDARGKAYTLLAEIFLMQHTCHWFCKSKAVASARLVMRHQTPYTKVLESVAPSTRNAYCALIAR